MSVRVCVLSIIVLLRDAVVVPFRIAVNSTMMCTYAKAHHNVTLRILRRGFVNYAVPRLAQNNLVLYYE